MFIVFDDIIADIEANKKLSPTVIQMFFKKKKTQYFTAFCITITFQSAKSYKTEHILLLSTLLTKENVWK